MAYGAEARLPSDQVCINFDNSAENIELTFRQRNIAVRRLDKTRKQLISELNARATKRNSATEESYTERDLRPGDRVLRSFEGRPSKLHPKWDGPFIIRDAYPNGTFSLMTSNGHVLKANINGSRIKKFNGSKDEFYYASSMLQKRDRRARLGRNRSSISAGTTDHGE